MTGGRRSRCSSPLIDGTRSSTVFALAPGRVRGGLQSDGPPCTSASSDAVSVVEAA